MLRAEAQWVGQVLSQLDTNKISPLLNVGSATADFREKVQPFIDQEIFAPLREREIIVHHLDIQDGNGIDLRGDLTDDSFVAGLGSRGYRALLCCNLLEHVPDPAAICAKLERLVPAGGYLVITVPNRFPYHPDPIDTMFRPDVASLVKLFPQCNLIQGAVLDCGTGWDYVDRNPGVMIAKLKHRISGMKEHGGVKGSASFLPWLFRHFRQTCVLLQRQPAKQ
jgi:SAM-dependent methyltransferase